MTLDHTPEKRAPFSVQTRPRVHFPLDHTGHSEAHQSPKSMTRVSPPRPSTAERRPCPASQEPSNEEGLFQARMPCTNTRCMSASAPEMWQLKHGPPPKRPRFRPVQCYMDPAPFLLPEPDVPMSGSPGEPFQMASSCPVYVAFCQKSEFVGKFAIPDGHQAGTPTVLETLGSIDEEPQGTTPSDGYPEPLGDAGWDTSEDEAMGGQQETEEGEDHAMDQDQDDTQDQDDEVFSFDFSPT